MSNCIFCSIIQGHIPSYVIYQDKNLLAILDRYPSTKGHILIMPKRHVADIHELNHEESAQILQLAQKIAAKMRDTLKMDGLNLIQNNGKAAGQVIDHFHLHLVPRYESDGVKITATPQDPPLEELEQLATLLKL